MCVGELCRIFEPTIPLISQGSFCPIQNTPPFVAMMIKMLNTMRGKHSKKNIILLHLRRYERSHRWLVVRCLDESPHRRDNNF